MKEKNNKTYKDLFMGNCHLMLGDCLEKMKDIPDGSVDLTVTSPPYDNLRTYNNSLDWGEHVWKPVLEELFRVTKKGGVVVWVVGDATIKGSETGTSFRQALYAKEIGFNLHDTMIYNKGGAGGAKGSNYCYTQTFEFMFVFSKGKPNKINLLKDRENKFLKKGVSSMRKKDGSLIKFTMTPNYLSKRTNVWDIRNGFMQGTKDKIAYQHPAIFPEQLANDHIISWSNEGDTVLDCFMGSGTTGKMALLNNRKFIGIEKDDNYFQIAKKRINEALKEKQQNLF
jgi:DNA modification methylase